jgi:hypothetical protein
MQLTKEQYFKDKIFELEMELKEQQSMLVTLSSYGFGDDLDEARNNLELEIQETHCYIQYYNDQLQYLEGQ